MVTAILKTLHLGTKQPVSTQPDTRSAKHFSKWIDERLGVLLNGMAKGDNARTYDDLQEFYQIAEVSMKRYDSAAQENLQKKLTNWKVKIVAAQKKKFLSAFTPFNKKVGNSLETATERRSALQEKMQFFHARPSDKSKAPAPLKPVSFPSEQELRDQELRVEALFHQVHFLVEAAPEGAQNDLAEMQTKLQNVRNSRFLLEKAVRDVQMLEKLIDDHESIKEELPALTRQVDAAERALNELIVFRSHEENSVLESQKVQKLYEDLSSSMQQLRDRSRSLMSRYPYLPLLGKVESLLHRAEEQEKKYKRFQAMLETHQQLGEYLTRKTETFEGRNRLHLLEEFGFEIASLQEALKHYLTPQQKPGSYFIVDHHFVVDLVNRVPRLKTKEADPAYNALIKKSIDKVERARQAVSIQNTKLSLGQWLLSLLASLLNWICSLKK